MIPAIEFVVFVSSRIFASVRGFTAQAFHFGGGGKSAIASMMTAIVRFGSVVVLVVFICSLLVG